MILNREKIILSIQKAFQGIPAPALLTLHVAEAHDSNDYDHDQTHHKKDHLGNWEDIPEHHLLKCSCALAHLNKEGIQYYLPAYMVWVLKNYEQYRKFDVMIDSVFFTLGTNPVNAPTHDYDVERFSLLTKSQIQCCIDFLQYFVDTAPKGMNLLQIKRALEHRWLALKS